MEAIAKAEASLGLRLEQLKRGRVCKLFVFGRADGMWILVRRGDPFRRDGAIEETGTGSVYYRPERYDVLRYDSRQGELAVNAEGNKRLINLYRQTVGELLFGDGDRFSKAAKYSLSPLRDAGEQSLVCTEIEGIDWVLLTEVQVYRGSTHGEIETRRARDLFATLRVQGLNLPEGRIVRATFRVKFKGARTARTVTIRSRNVASYTHDADAAVIEDWLVRQGFVTVPGKDSDADATDAVSRS